MNIRVAMKFVDFPFLIYFSISGGNRALRNNDRAYSSVHNIYRIYLRLLKFTKRSITVDPVVLVPFAYFVQPSEPRKKTPKNLLVKYLIYTKMFFISRIYIILN